MPARMSTGFINLLGNAIVTGLTDGVIRFYNGSQPADANYAPSGDLIGSATQDGGAFTNGSATNGLELTNTNGVLTIKSGENWIFKSVQAGTVRWARFEANADDDDSESTTLVRLDLSVGVTTGNIKMPQGITFTAADQLAPISAFTLTLARTVAA